MADEIQDIINEDNLESVISSMAEQENTRRIRQALFMFFRVSHDGKKVWEWLEESILFETSLSTDLNNTNYTFSFEGMRQLVLLFRTMMNEYTEEIKNGSSPDSDTTG